MTKAQWLELINEIAATAAVAGCFWFGVVEEQWAQGAWCGVVALGCQIAAWRAKWDARNGPTVDSVQPLLVALARMEAEAPEYWHQGVNYSRLCALRTVLAQALSRR